MPVVQASKQDALQEMQQYRSGLSANLGDKQQQWQDEARQTSTADRWRLLAVAGQAGQTALQELNSKNFKSFLEEAGSTLVVVDFYTDWCGPCKVMLPHLEQLSGELGDTAKVVKFNCNKDNKEMGKELGIKVAPTFHLYKKSNKVAEISGAKIDELRALISKHK